MKNQQYKIKYLILKSQLNAVMDQVMQQLCISKLQRIKSLKFLEYGDGQCEMQKLFIYAFYEQLESQKKDQLIQYLIFFIMILLSTLFRFKHSPSISFKLNNNLNSSIFFHFSQNKNNQNSSQASKNTNSSSEQNKSTSQPNPQPQPKPKSFKTTMGWIVFYLGIAAFTFASTHFYKKYQYQKQYFKKQQQKKQILDKLQQLQLVFSKKVQHVNNTYPTTQKRMQQKLVSLTNTKDTKMKNYYNGMYLQKLLKSSQEHDQCQKKYDNYKDKVMKKHFNIDNIQTQIPQLQEMIRCYDILQNYFKLMQTMIADPKLKIKI